MEETSERNNRRSEFKFNHFIVENQDKNATFRNLMGVLRSFFSNAFKTGNDYCVSLPSSTEILRLSFRAERRGAISLSYADSETSTRLTGGGKISTTSFPITEHQGFTACAICRSAHPPAE
ncbi:hypothetical protein GWN75_17300 [candidate division KSB1 bacterium]|nr:hypothetical protein [candidate division KSB1 bacterium]NIW20104.1 hypothetical protein [candidate division KSB1 bacterium]NIW70597.1 hypothetical protein [candidate division KSB1 bacterium]